jgi:hypothetical protein
MSGHLQGPCRRPRQIDPFCTPRPVCAKAAAAAPYRRECARRTGSRTCCTPATRDRTGRLHRDVLGVRPPAGTPAYSMIPGWRPPPGPGSPGVRRHPAGSPAIPEPGPRARRHPGVPAGLPFTPCAVTLDQLHRQGDGPRAAGTADGDASAPRQSRKTLSAAIEDVQTTPGTAGPVWQ